MFQMLRDLLSGRFQNRRHWELIIAEEQQRERVIERIVERVESRVEELTTTHKHEVRDFLLMEKSRLFTVRGRGVVREILLIADSADLKIRVKVDDKDVVYDTFTDLILRSPFTSEFDALQDEAGNYVFVMSNVGFRKNVEVELEGSGVKIKYFSVNYNLIRRKRGEER